MSEPGPRATQNHRNVLWTWGDLRFCMEFNLWQFSSSNILAVADFCWAEGCKKYTVWTLFALHLSYGRLSFLSSNLCSSFLEIIHHRSSYFGGQTHVGGEFMT